MERQSDCAVRHLHMQISHAVLQFNEQKQEYENYIDLDRRLLLKLGDFGAGAALVSIPRVGARRMGEREQRVRERERVLSPCAPEGIEDRHSFLCL